MEAQSDNILILDGATGTELERCGVDIGLPLWSARAMIEAPEALFDVHTSYINAGAGAITTNTFRTHARSLGKAGMADQAESLTWRAVEIACAARDECGQGTLILGSDAPLEDCYRPDRAPDPSTCREEHGRLIGHLVNAGVDLILIETMCSAHEALAAASAAEDAAPGKWGISFCLRPDGPPGVLLDGEPLATILPSLASARFVGINCIAAPGMARQVAHLRSLLPGGQAIAAYANIGYADGDGAWVTTDAVEPARYAAYARAWVDAGAEYVGGCCGTTPETIQEVVAQCR
ncbi:MAG: homocysteine S-methyltransferase family protein [Planctomycetes bacterium]|nr:homocysteine S-methyltransferase family protein [Planctomycetota bacterium]MCP4839125.1 homocysteine S-methyltransferase family protein [Planctomycetota bacterium]